MLSTVDASTPGPCACQEDGPRYPESSTVTDLGVDQTDGRFADVAVNRCERCGQLWLHYQVEYEHISRSGRWACVPVSAAEAAGVTAETAEALIAARPWRIYGGSYWGHVGKRGSGQLLWG